jgi:hypothetical protein
MSAPEQPTLCADGIPHVRRHDADRGWRHIQLFGDHVVRLGRRLESADAINAERFFEPTIDAGVNRKPFSLARFERATSRIPSVAIG